MLQYLEGCLLVNQIVDQTMHQSGQKCIQIFFVLPNDEIKYYQDATDAFAKDIEFLMTQLHDSIMDEIKIIINFAPFQYGDYIHQRPYNDPGSVIKPHELQSLHLLSNVGD